MDTHRAVIDRETALAYFKKTFRELAPYKHRYEVFKDFVTMAAYSLHICAIISESSGGVKN
jgi:hypothetical protein